MKRRVDVVLLGHRFTVRTEKDEAYVHSLAAQVARRVEDVRRSMRNASPQEQALLVALTLLEELTEEREHAAVMRADVRRNTESMISKLTAALREDLPPPGPEQVDEESDAHELHVAVVAQRQD